MEYHKIKQPTKRNSLELECYNWNWKKWSKKSRHFHISCYSLCKSTLLKMLILQRLSRIGTHYFMRNAIFSYVPPQQLKQHSNASFCMLFAKCLSSPCFNKISSHVPILILSPTPWGSLLLMLNLVLRNIS